MTRQGTGVSPAEENLSPFRPDRFPQCSSAEARDSPTTFRANSPDAFNNSSVKQPYPTAHITNGGSSETGTVQLMGATFRRAPSPVVTSGQAPWLMSR